MTHPLRRWKVAPIALGPFFIHNHALQELAVLLLEKPMPSSSLAASTKPKGEKNPQTNPATEPSRRPTANPHRTGDNHHRFAALIAAEFSFPIICQSSAKLRSSAAPGRCPLRRNFFAKGRYYEAHLRRFIEIRRLRIGYRLMRWSRSGSVRTADRSLVS